MQGTVLFGRKVRFSASHHYEIVGESKEKNTQRFGLASETHQHEWELTIWLKGPVAENTGMMVDLAEVDGILHQEVVLPFHRRHFNLVDPFFKMHQPTTEILANYFAKRLLPRLGSVELVRLRIAESEDLFAEWIP